MLVVLCILHRCDTADGRSEKASAPLMEGDDRKATRPIRWKIGAIVFVCVALWSSDCLLCALSVVVV